MNASELKWEKIKKASVSLHAILGKRVCVVTREGGLMRV